jgi:hypothetical protein
MPNPQKYKNHIQQNYNAVACRLKAWISESERTSIARQRLGNYVLYLCLGMSESRISGFNLETHFPRQQTEAFQL